MTTFEEYGSITLPADEPSSGSTYKIDRTGAGSSVHGSAESGGWYQVLLTGENLGEGILTSTKAVCPPLLPTPSIALLREWATS